MKDFLFLSIRIAILIGIWIIILIGIFFFSNRTYTTLNEITYRTVDQNKVFFSYDITYETNRWISERSKEPIEKQLHIYVTEHLLVVFHGENILQVLEKGPHYLKNIKDMVQIAKREFEYEFFIKVKVNISELNFRQVTFEKDLKERIQKIKVDDLSKNSKKI